MNARDILKEEIAIQVSGFAPAKTMNECVGLAEAIIELFMTRVETELQQLDGKRCGLVWHRKDRRITEGFWALIPQDSLSVPNLQDYLERCTRYAERPQVEGVIRVIQRFVEWQNQHPDQMKVPDVKPDDKVQ